MNVKRYEESKYYPFDDFVVDPMGLAQKQDSFFRKKFRRYMTLLNMDKYLSLNLINYRDYADKAISYFISHPEVSICVLPNYDHSPRSGKLATVLTESSPNEFGDFLKHVKKILDKRDSHNDFLFIKAWNEWGEGNYLEPDLKYGHGFLEQVKKVFGINNTLIIE